MPTLQSLPGLKNTQRPFLASSTFFETKTFEAIKSIKIYEVKARKWCWEIFKEVKNGVNKAKAVKNKGDESAAN